MYACLLLAWLTSQTYANKRVFSTMPGVNTVFAKAGIPINLVRRLWL
jgi:hypothetical protein